MKSRLITASWLIPAVALIVFFGSAANPRWQLNNSETLRMVFKYVFLSIATILGLLAVNEAVSVDPATGRAMKLLYFVIALAIMASNFFDEEKLSLKITIIVFAIFVLMMLIIPVMTTTRINDTFFSFVFVSIIAFSVKLLALIILHNGWPSLLWLILIPISTDTMAYFGGRLVGKTKLAPVISPKKTREGAVIGVLFGILIPTIYLIIWNIVHPSSLNLLFANITTGSLTNISNPVIILFFSLMAPIISILSVLGDLSFSSIKRHYKVKDFSKALSEHGGLLDRLDSVIFATIAFYIINLIIHL